MIQLFLYYIISYILYHVQWWVTVVYKILLSFIHVKFFFFSYLNRLSFLIFALHISVIQSSVLLFIFINIIFIYVLLFSI